MYVASATCLLLARTLNSSPVFFTVNLRFDITPAAIVSPSSASQVSDAVKVGVTCHLPVVARSGGVRIFLVIHFAV
jgi:FAD/FMN-containing dehydrogenase